jgi:DNA-binding NtrC family response regulator
MESNLSNRTQEKPSALGIEAPASTVLLVEEDPEDLQYYASVLRLNGYPVRTCSSYLESMRRLASGQYALVVVGQGSCLFEGRKVVEQIKETDPELPVLVVARCVEMNCYIEAIQLGATDYLAGPLIEAEISRAVSKYVHPYRPKAMAKSGRA